MKKDIMKIFKTAGFLLLLFFFSAIPIALFNIDYDSFSNSQRIIYMFICDVLYLALIIFSYRKTLIHDFKEFISDFINNIEYAFKFWLVGFIVMILSNLFIVYVAQGGIAQNEESVRSLIDIAPIFMIFEVSIYAPLTEELIFRKGFRDIFKSKWLFIISSGLTFGALHVISSVSSATDLLFLIPYCALGFSFSYLYYKSDNIFSSISMHAMHNTMSILLYLIGVSL